MKKREEREVDPILELKATCLGGCVTMIVVVILIAITFFLFSCNGNWERKDPKSVTYREKVMETDSTEVWRTVTYKLSTVSVDTIPKSKRVKSTLEYP